MTGIDHFSSYFTPPLFIQSIVRIGLRQNESTGQFPEPGGASNRSTRQSAAGRHATKWWCIFRHPCTYHERIEQIPTTSWMAANCASTLSCCHHTADVCFSTEADCERLVNTDSFRITQLGLVKPEYTLAKTFNIATSFEREQFDRALDRVRLLRESRVID